MNIRLLDQLGSPERIQRLPSRVDPADGCDALAERRWRLNVKLNEALRRIDERNQQEQTA